MIGRETEGALRVLGGFKFLICANVYGYARLVIIHS